MYFNEDAVLYLVTIHTKENTTVSVFDKMGKALVAFQRLMKDSMYRHGTNCDYHGGSFKFCTTMGRYQVNEDEFIAMSETELNKVNTDNI